jgi:hypothetical protein
MLTGCHRGADFDKWEWLPLQQSLPYDKKPAPSSEDAGFAFSGLD